MRCNKNEVLSGECMKNKKWKFPSRETIVAGIQFFLILYMITMGFIFTYLFIWFAIDSLPNEPWSVPACAAAGLISMGGLFTWITKGNKGEVSKKEMCESAKSVCNGNCETCAWNEEV